MSKYCSCRLPGPMPDIALLEYTAFLVEDGIIYKRPQ